MSGTPECWCSTICAIFMSWNKLEDAFNRGDILNGSTSLKNPYFLVLSDRLVWTSTVLWQSLTCLLFPGCCSIVFPVPYTSVLVTWVLVFCLFYVLRLLFGGGGNRFCVGSRGRNVLFSCPAQEHTTYLLYS